MLHVEPGDRNGPHRTAIGGRRIVSPLATLSNGLCIRLSVHGVDTVYRTASLRGVALMLPSTFKLRPTFALTDSHDSPPSPRNST